MRIARVRARVPGHPMVDMNDRLKSPSANRSKILVLPTSAVGDERSVQCVQCRVLFAHYF